MKKKKKDEKVSDQIYVKDRAIFVKNASTLSREHSNELHFSSVL